LLYPTGGGQSFDLIAALNAALTVASAPFSVSLVTDPASPRWGQLGVTTSQAYLALSSRGVVATAARSDMLWRMFFPHLFRVDNFVHVNEGSGARVYYAGAPLGGCLHLRRLVTSLRTQQAYLSAQGVANDGTTATVLYGVTRRYALDVSLQGALPRELLWNEHAQMLSFLDACGRGSPAMIYPHSDVSTPHERHDDAWNVNGWLFGMLRQESLVWQPDSPEWYQQWDKELIFDRLVTAPVA
jgi:hypothetical protein